MERKNTRAVIYLLILSLVSTFLTYLLYDATAIADTPNYNVDAIVKGLLAAEAQFADLRIEYSTTRRNWREPNQPFEKTQAIYVHKTDPNQKKDKGLRYFDFQVFLVDPNAKGEKLLEDTLTSFDGERTIVLDRKVESGKAKKGFIFADYASKYFSSYHKDPHTKIWYFGGKPIGEILKENKNTFRIESDTEILNDIPTMKLAGQILDGKVTMTLWVSPERNFLPLKTQFAKSDGERLFMGTTLLDLAKLPNGIWYPKKIQSPAVPLTDPNPAYFLIYEIKNVSFEPISAEFFTPDFPPNTKVYDDILKVSYTTY